MMARLDLDAIKRAHTLPEVVAAAGIKLLRAGSEYKACCPFHQDRTPSFTIYDGGLRWCCFGGCGGGDVFDFLARLHRKGLREVADMLAGGNVPSTHVEPLPVQDKTGRITASRFKPMVTRATMRE